MLSKLAVLCDSPPPDVPVAFESLPVPLSSSSKTVQPLELSYPHCSVPRVVNEVAIHGIPRLQLSDSYPSPSPRSYNSTSRFRSPLYTITERRQSQLEESDDPAPLMKRKKQRREAKKNNPLHEVDWLNVSPRVLQLVKEDLPKLFEHVRSGSSSSSSIVLVSPRTVSSLPLLCAVVYSYGIA
ncbi:unnamed protein product [Cylicostephanus goldi]|uniref:Uncharacterized protein n=1 Tax=Cylicostephanus goldi TaxID=71465 RepID=A0A3P6S8I3_CYLGO|nr:unnamed protein product [Cylicostephanus goldi]